MALLEWIYVAILAVGTLNGEPVVKSALGTVFGKTDCYESVEVESFLGIPFARPPLGDLRFAFPQPSGSFGELNATEYSASCPQTRIMPLRSHPESEDCLYLNIYRKAGTQPNSKRPVIFVIHGGAFCVGAGSHGFYNGLPITAIGDVVVVSINYRLGILGFADMKDLAPGNLGLFDQLLALQWVHDNIAAFGGDPARVTLMGVSAGSMSVSALVNTPLVRGKDLFKQAVMDAGVMSPSMVMSQDASLERVKVASAKVGCDTEGEKLLSCLRKVDATVLIDASFDRNFSPIFTFAPTIDGKFISAEPHGDARKDLNEFLTSVRLIVGTAKNEGTLFAAMYPAVKAVRTEAGFLDFLKDITRGFFYSLALENQNVKTALLRTYFGKLTDHRDDLAEFITDGSFICPSNAVVKNYAKFYKNVYVYSFGKVMKGNYGMFDPEILGAYHGSPFANMFGSFLAMPEEELGGKLDPEDERFMRDSVEMLADFVNSDEAPKFRGVTWPNYANKEGILIIDDKPVVRKDLVHDDRCKRLFPLLSFA